jgi:hypothetical protein
VEKTTGRWICTGKEDEDEDEDGDEDEDEDEDGDAGGADNPMMRRIY